MIGRIVWRSLLLLCLAVISAACVDLAGEPEIVATMPPPTAMGVSESPAMPASMPDIARGQQIFAENCTRCHGENGAGGGELVASGEVPRMPSFLEASHVRDESPASYFNIITNGNIINLMPPWADALTEQERWDVTMYVYTLNYDPQQVLIGAGQYPDAPDTFSLESDTALNADVSESASLPPDEAWAATAYRRLKSVRNFSNLTGVDIAGLVNDAPPPESLIFTGTISNGTAGATVPAGLTVVLRYGNAQDGFQMLDTTADSSGAYRFENVPYQQNYFYAPAAVYQNRGYTGDVLSARNVSEINDLPITLYEVTDDPSVITLSNIAIQVDHTVVDGLGTGLVFAQTNTYMNTSDRMFYLTPQGQNVSVSLAVQLPPAAIILNDPNDPRYIIAQDYYTLIDTQPVYPGEHTVEAVYFLSYEDGAVIDLAMTNPFDGSLDIALAVPQLDITGDSLQPVNEETSAEAESETPSIKRYHGDYHIAASENLVFDITGAAFGSRNTSDNSGVITSNFLLPMLAVIVIVFAAAIAAIIYLQQRTRGNVQREIDRLIAQIAQLESLHEAGQINHDVFQRQRQELKTRLSSIMTQRRENPDE